ncbi:MAG: leucyl aminopeptidase [Planctomycetota bacterium]|nr:MAG: leucyl aminopeptidase [Planctomycetota bacterium]
MQVSVKTGTALDAKTDLLVLVHLEKDTPPLPPAFDDAFAQAKKVGDLPQSLRASCLLYPSEAAPAKRLLLVCAGRSSEVDAESLRRIGAIAQKRADDLGCADFVLALSQRVSEACALELACQALAEGAGLAAYRYIAPSKDKAKPAKLKRASLMAIEGKLPAACSKAAKTGMLRAEATCFARELGNKAGNLMTPSILASESKKLANNRVKVTVFDEARMKKEKMNALLGVSRGSREPAKLIFFDYDPFKGKASKGRTIAIVGKGLTFDAGGISLKPSAGMDEMRYDMCGGAAVVGLFHALASGALSPKLRVVGAVPASENLLDGDAQKPGDIVTACDGTTIEVLNTDAEGRLILCDALAYVTKTYKPAKMVDLATLTGAVVMALGHEMSGIMGDDEVCKELLEAGESSGDRCWQLPLWDVHKDMMKSKFADLRNINSGKADGAGSTSGGAFLSNFVGDTPWAHIDIAGAAWGAKAKDYYEFGATGVGVRLLLDWLANQ